MPEAARKTDMTTHSPPLNPGPGSSDVKTGFLPQWRALPAGMGAGIESASKKMKELMDSPSLDPVSTAMKLGQIGAALAQDAGAAAAKGAAGAPGAVSGGFTSLMTTNTALTATYTTAAAVPGGEPAAKQAYTEGIKAAAAAFASSAMGALAGVTDMHMCSMPAGPVPHGPGVVTKGSKTVFINNLPAARKDDKVFEACGGEDPIAMGCGTVLIGDDGGGPPSGDAGSAVDEEQVEEEQQVQSSEAALSSAAGSAVPLIEVAQQCRIIPPVPLKSWVMFRLIDDDTEEPFAGVPFKVRLPDGTEVVQATDENGEIEIEDIEETFGDVDILEILDQRALEVKRVDTTPA